MTVKLIGRDDVALSGANGPNGINMSKWTAASSGVLSEFHVRIAASVSGNIRIGIYADSSGSPGALLGYTSSTAISSGLERSFTVALVSSISITSGTVYWLAMNTDASLIGYKAETGISKYKNGVTYAALPDPAGAGYTDSTTMNEIISGYGYILISPTGIASAFASGSPRLICIIAPSSIASLQAFGLPTVSHGAGFILPSGIASLQAVGTPTVVNRQIITPTGVASAFAFGSPAAVLHLQIITPSGSASAFASGVPGLYWGHIGCSGISSAEAFGVVTVLRDRIHLILEGSYEAESEVVNRSYVVGQDLAGFTVTGSAITQAEVDLVGERLEVQHTPEAVTAAMAAAVAANTLARARLGSKKGAIVIPPHCGLELWDVVYIYDEYGNQSANYRVASYVFEYDVLQSKWQHEIDLCAP